MRNSGISIALGIVITIFGQACSLKFRFNGVGLLDSFSASVSAPGSLLKGGSSQTVSFVIPPSFVSGNLEFASDGTTYSVVGPILAGASTQSWTVPLVDSTSARLRISYVDSTGAQTVVSGFFEVDSTAPVISLNNLLGGDIVPGNSSVAINWTATDANLGSTPISIEYSSDGGTSYSTLASAVANSGAYNWLTPLVNSSTYRVRVKATDSVGNVSAYSASISNFTINGTTPTVLVTYPNGGEYIHPGPTITTVTWSYANLPTGASTATIEYSVNSGGTWNPIAGATGITNTGSYSWAAPAVEASTYRIRVSVTDSLAATTIDTSNSDFTIDNTPPTLAITAPVGGSYLQGNSPTNITWTVSDNNPLGATPIKLEYSPNTGGTTWTTIATAVAAAPATYAWSVPNTQGTAYRVRITATDQAGQVQTTQTPNFWVDTTNPVVAITVPAAAGIYSGGATMNIAWTATDTNYGLAATPIKIEFSSNGGTSWSTVPGAGAIANTSPFAWTLPSVDSSTYRVRVTATDLSGRQTTTTTSNFTIDSTNPVVTVTAPNGAEAFKGGQLTNITWTASDTNFGTTPIKLEYSLNNGTSWTTIAAAIANSSPYAWTVPLATNSQQCLIRATATDNAGRTTADSSNAVFTIDSTNPSINLTAPTGSNLYLRGGSAYNITWTASDATYALATNPIKLEVSSDGGTSWANIIAATPNTSPYSWTVPSVDSATYRVRATATDAATNTATSQSSANFTIDNTNPVLTLSAPVGGEVLAYGDGFNITWTSSDTNFGATPITLEYSDNSGTSWSTISSGVASTPGTYLWTAPSFSSTTYKVRAIATDLSGRQTVATSPNFTVQPLPALVATPATTTYANGNVAYTNMYVHGARAGHSMSQLADGTYLLTGGGILDYNRTVSSVSVFDPVSLTFTAKAPMFRSRWGHSQVTLPSGKVLVIGGSYRPGSGTRSEVELYDPATDHWKQVASMSTPRSWFGTFLRADGKVLVVGGFDPWTNSSELQTSEIYDPATNLWTAGPSYPTKIFSPIVVPLSNGKVLFAGGGTDVTAGTTAAYLYDPALNTFTATGSMTVGRRNSSAFLFTAAELSAANDRVYVFGGYNGVTIGSVESYDVGTGLWTTRTAMSQVRRQMGAVKFQDTDTKWKVWISGGGTGQAPYTFANSTQVYEPIAGTYSGRASIPNGGRFNAGPMGSGAIALSGNRFAHLGGIDNGAGGIRPYVQIFNQTANTWTKGASMGSNRYSFVGFKITGGAHSGKHMSCGGLYNLIAGQTDSDCEMYNPATNGIETGPSMPAAVSRADSVTLPDGRVVVIGGLDSAGAMTGAVKIYDPITHAWTSGTASPILAMNRALLVVSGNKILVAGGTTDETTPVLTNQTYWYDPDADTWTLAAAMPGARSRTRGIATNAGRFFIVGGWNGTTSGVVGDTNMWEYLPGTGPGTDSWVVRPAMAQGRYWHTDTFVENGANDFIIVALGFTGVQLAAPYNGSSPTLTVEHYSLTTNTWSTKTSIAAGQGRGLYGGYWIPTWNRLVVVGGWSGGAAQPNVYSYNPSGAGTWSAIGATLTNSTYLEGRAQNYCGAIVMDDGRLMINGGAFGSASPSLSSDMGWEIYSFKAPVDLTITGGDGLYDLSLLSGLGTVYTKLRQYIPPWSYVTGTSQVQVQDGSSNSDVIDVIRN